MRVRTTRYTQLANEASRAETHAITLKRLGYEARVVNRQLRLARRLHRDAADEFTRHPPQPHTRQLELWPLEEPTHVYSW